jgi:UDP-N-acetylglucosamine 2-epimerase (non-hydrolysing)
VRKTNFMLIDVIAGARPNFMKVAALFAVANQYPDLTLRLIHTGQHYDVNMSDVFFRDLELPEPVLHLGVGSGSHAEQTGAIMVGYEGWLKENPPDLVVVVGDVNSTLACTLVAAKENIRVAHVEAGLRSFDLTMPEEVNRIVTDSLSSFLFATEASGVVNLAREGRPPSRIYLVGHVMIDTLLRMKPKAEALSAPSQFGVQPYEYAYLTLHRPSNVDQDEALAVVCQQVLWMAERLPVIFPVHPRTHARLEASSWNKRLGSSPHVHLVEPFSYLASLSLTLNALFVVTDSGGLQEETSALGVPCLTLRQTTERPITVTEGTNTLIAGNWDLFRKRVDEILASQALRRSGQIPYWDGNAAKRILNIISNSRGELS